MYGGTAGKEFGRDMFEGFTPKTGEFLWELSFNNERSWFMAHKDEFEDVLNRPFKALAADTFALTEKQFPQLGCKLHVARIYRDARRLHGRGPYKEHLWFTIERPHERFESVPALYFELAPNYYSYGCGYWDAGAATMAKLRARIDNDPKPLERLARRLNKSKFVLSGEEFKRPKGDAGKLLNPWYNRKNIAIGYDDNPEGVLFTPQLKDNVLDGFRFLMPYYQYLDTLAGDMEPNR